MATPIWLTSVWTCTSTDQAEQLLAGTREGYVYQRDGHPNADLLADKCRALHEADFAIPTSSGMSALATVLLAEVQPGDQIVVVENSTAAVCDSSWGKPNVWGSTSV